jgi:hypothetical protein
MVNVSGIFRLPLADDLLKLGSAWQYQLELS